MPHRHLSLLFLGTLATQFTAFLASNPVLRGMIGQVLVTLFTLGLAYLRKSFDVPATVAPELAAKPDPYDADPGPAPATRRSPPPLPVVGAVLTALALSVGGCASTAGVALSTWAASHLRGPTTWSSAQWGICVGEAVELGPREVSAHACTRTVSVPPATPSDAGVPDHGP